MARPELPHIGIILVGALPWAGWWRKRKATNAAPAHTVFYLVVAYTWLLWKCWFDWAPFVKHKYQISNKLYTLENLQNCPGWKTHFFNRRTPQEDKWVQVHTCFSKKKHVTTNKLKHNKPFIFFFMYPDIQKENSQKKYHPGYSTWPNYIPIFWRSRFALWVRVTFSQNHMAVIRIPYTRSSSMIQLYR